MRPKDFFGAAICEDALGAARAAACEDALGVTRAAACEGSSLFNTNTKEGSRVLINPGSFFAFQAMLFSQPLCILALHHKEIRRIRKKVWKCSKNGGIMSLLSFRQRNFFRRRTAVRAGCG